MTSKWGAMNILNRERTGRFYRALIGPCKGQIGEAVYFHNWGGLDLQFDDDSIAAFANDDVEEVTSTS